MHAQSTRKAIPSVHKAKPTYIGLRLKRYGPYATMRLLGLNGIESVPARFCVTNPAMFSATPARKNIAPRIHRNAPCRKLVGTTHSRASAAMIGKTNSSGGAIGKPERTSSGGNSDGMER